MYRPFDISNGIGVDPLRLVGLFFYFPSIIGNVRSLS